MSERRRISSGGPWEAAAGYSRAIGVGDGCWVAGTTDAGPDGRSAHPGDIAAQTRQSLTNLANILAAGGSSLANVLKANVYLRRMDDIAQVDGVFREFFPGEPPPRTTVGAVLGTPGGDGRPGMDIEIELVAYAGDELA